VVGLTEGAAVLGVPEATVVEVGAVVTEAIAGCSVSFVMSVFAGPGFAGMADGVPTSKNTASGLPIGVVGAPVDARYVSRAYVPSGNPGLGHSRQSSLPASAVV
jgi:hypothetical protein